MSHLVELLLAGFVGGVAALVVQLVARRLEAGDRARDLAARVKQRAGERRFWIRLTPEQREELRIASGKDVEALDYAEDELEARQAPKLPKEKHLHGLWVMLGLDD
ncbi:MAG: hypothetical protein PVF27_00830 [Gemmatimonadales bacterium]|jgi:hypothetical protein